MPAGTLYDVAMTKKSSRYSLRTKNNLATFTTLVAASRFVNACMSEMGELTITSRDVGHSLDESIAHWQAKGFGLEHASILALAKHASDAHVRLVCVECVLRKGWAFRSELV